MAPTRSKRETLLIAWPILPGKEEAWRRFAQEIQEIHAGDYEESRKRLGIRRESTHLSLASHILLVIVSIEADDPEQILPQMVASEYPFDEWFRRQMLELHGIDMALSTSIPTAELVWNWNATGKDWEE